MTKILPNRPWTRREWDFAGMQIGDSIFETESLGYFRTAAASYFNSTKHKTYFTRKGERDGKKGLILYRHADKPISPA